MLVTWLPMGNATWWKADEDESDGKCLVSKPDPKNKDGKPVMVWVDCDWINGRLVTLSVIISHLILMMLTFKLSGNSRLNNHSKTVNNDEAYCDKTTWQVFGAE